MPVLTKINSNVIADDAITGDMLGASAYLANTATQNISGTYSENRMYTSDAYTLSGNATVNSHLTLSSVKPNSDVVLTAGGAYTLTGTGVLSAGSLLAKTRSDLTGMTGVLGSAVTGFPAITGVGALNSGSIGSSVTGFTGIKSQHKWYIPTQYYGTSLVNWGTTATPMTQEYAVGGVMSVTNSGQWEFPSTGYWYIAMQTNTQMLAGVSDTNTRWVQQEIMNTVDGWSNTGATAQAYNQIGGAGGGSTYEAEYIAGIFKCENTSTHQVKFATAAENTTYWWAGSHNNFVTFLRIGDV